MEFVSRVGRYLVLCKESSAASSHSGVLLLDGILDDFPTRLFTQAPVALCSVRMPPSIDFLKEDIHIDARRCASAAGSVVLEYEHIQQSRPALLLCMLSPCKM